MKKILVSLLGAAAALLMFESCTNTEFDEAAELKKPAVSAFFYTSRDTQQVRVYKQYGINDTARVTPDMNATVTLSINNGAPQTFQKKIGTQPRNNYFFLNCVPGAAQRMLLSVTYNGITATAYTVIPAAPSVRLTPVETLKVDTGMDIQKVMQNLKAYPALRLTVSNWAQGQIHSMRITNIERDSTRKRLIYRGNTQMINRFIRPGATFQENGTDINLRRISRLGNHIITLQRFDNLYANFIRSTQNQGMDPDMEIDVEDMTVAPTNVNNGLGLFTAMSVLDSIRFFVKIK